MKNIESAYKTYSYSSVLQKMFKLKWLPLLFQSDFFTQWYGIMHISCVHLYIHTLIIYKSPYPNKSFIDILTVYYVLCTEKDKG
jgi:hypothetical protein